VIGNDGGGCKDEKRSHMTLKASVDSSLLCKIAMPVKLEGKPTRKLI